MGVGSPNHKTIYGRGRLFSMFDHIVRSVAECCIVFLSQAADTLRGLFASHQLYDKAMVCSFYPNVIFQVRKKYSDCCYC